MVTNVISAEFSPLLTTREAHGRQIAKLGGIRQLGASYVVPSQSIAADAPTYLVAQSCTCLDYAKRTASWSLRPRCPPTRARRRDAETGAIVLPKKRNTYKHTGPPTTRPRPTRRRTPSAPRSCSCAWEPVAKARRGRHVGAGGEGPSRKTRWPRAPRLIEVGGVDDLLTERHLSSRVCPHCGHPPEDFVDEETVVTEQPTPREFTVLDGGKQ